MTPERVRAANVGEIRRRYETARLPVVPAARAREDVFALLADRKALQRAGEALMMAALPCTGDANLKRAVDEFRAVLEGRANGE